MTSSSDSSSLYTSTAQFGPSGSPLLTQHSRPTLAFKLLFFFRQLPTFSLCTLTTVYHYCFSSASCPWLFLFTSCFLFFSLTLSGFFNRMLEASDPGALNCFTLFRLIPLTLFVSRNLTLTYFPLSKSLDSLLFHLIPPTSGLVFFLLMSQTLAARRHFLDAGHIRFETFYFLSFFA